VKGGKVEKIKVVRISKYPVLGGKRYMSTARMFTASPAGKSIFGTRTVNLNTQDPVFAKTYGRETCRTIKMPA